MKKSALLFFIPVLILAIGTTRSVAAQTSARTSDAPVLQEADSPAQESQTHSPQRITGYCYELARKGGLAALAYPCAMALSLEAKLPDFVCTQTTTRHKSPTNWNQPPSDVIRAEIQYVGGRESYSQITVNGRPTQRGMVELSGVVSVGEFGTMLQQVFEQRSATQFKLGKETGSLLTFDFRVPRETSIWTMHWGRASMRVGYKGRLRIDKATGRVTSIHQKAERVSALPFLTHEVSVDYAEVKLGDRGTFLLPVKSKVVQCSRGPTSNCFENEIRFENCHKFMVDSRMISEEDGQGDRSPQ